MWFLKDYVWILLKKTTKKQQHVAVLRKKDILLENLALQSKNYLSVRLKREKKIMIIKQIQKDIINTQNITHK